MLRCISNGIYSEFLCPYEKKRKSKQFVEIQKETATETHAVRHLDSVKVNYIFKSSVPAIRNDEHSEQQLHHLHSA